MDQASFQFEAVLQTQAPKCQGCWYASPHLAGMLFKMLLQSRLCTRAFGGRPQKLVFPPGLPPCLRAMASLLAVLSLSEAVPIKNEPYSVDPEKARKFTRDILLENLNSFQTRARLTWGREERGPRECDSGVQLDLPSSLLCV